MNELKITEAQYRENGVVSAADRLTGNAADNKAVFDKYPKFIGERYNALVDALASVMPGASGAAQIGAEQISGAAGGTVQALLVSLKALIDACLTNEAAELALNLKSDKSVTNEHIKTVTFDAESGIFVFTKENGTQLRFDTALEKVAVNWKYDAVTQSLVLTLVDGSTQIVSLSEFVTPTEFTDSEQVEFSAEGGKVTARIKSGSITDELLSSALAESLRIYAQTAAQAAQEAGASAANAAESAESAAASAKDTTVNTTLSQTYRMEAVQARNAAQNSAAAAAASEANAKNSENNAKTHADRAEAAASSLETDAQTAAQAAQEAGASAARAAASEQKAYNSEQVAAQAAENAVQAENSANASASAAADVESRLGGYVTDAEDAAAAAQEAKAAAEKARDEAQAIAGGDFASTAYVDNKAATAESNAKTYADTKNAETLSDAKSYTDTKIAAIPTPDVSGQINAHNTDTEAHSDIRTALSDKAPASHTHDDRYYTEMEVDNLLEKKSPSTHTHTKSQITDFPTSMTPTAHNQSASTITGGVFAGQVKAGSSVQAHSTSLLRNSALVSTATNPTVNGEINWTCS